MQNRVYFTWDDVDYVASGEARDSGYIELPTGEFLQVIKWNESFQPEQFVLLEVSPPGWCLSGDTEICLLDGRNEKISNLVGQEVFVYSIDENLNIVAGEACNIMPTRVSSLVRVYLDNDSYVDTTPDHRFMLRDGSFKEAQHLSVGESLMPLYKEFPEDKRFYEWVYNPGKNNWQATHRIMAKKAPKEARNSKGQFTGWVVHHIDLNKYNNCPNNLIWMSPKEHGLLHKQLNSSAEAREKSSKNMMKLNEKLWYEENYKEWRERKKESNKIVGSNNLKKLWQNEEFKKEVSARSKETIKKAQQAYNGSELQKENSSKNLKKTWQKNREVMLEACKKGGKASLFGSEEHKKLVSESNKKRCLEGRCGHKSHKDRLNHKVVRIEFLEGNHQTYDLTVPNYNNFALTNGVFVHNSGTVKAMKKHKDIDNPFALAWSMKKKGNKPHYKPEPKDSSKSDKEPEKKKKYKKEDKKKKKAESFKEFYKIKENMMGQPKQSNKDFVRQVFQKQAPTMNAIEPDEYPPIPGMEGPFQYKNGRILYYNPREGKYYDRKTDTYLDNSELNFMM
jgi:hypothetical protein